MSEQKFNQVVDESVLAAIAFLVKLFLGVTMLIAFAFSFVAVMVVLSGRALVCGYAYFSFILRKIQEEKMGVAI